jgi:hypothetical protein
MKDTALDRRANRYDGLFKVCHQPLRGRWELNLAGLAKEVDALGMPSH